MAPLHPSPMSQTNLIPPRRNFRRVNGPIYRSPLPSHFIPFIISPMPNPAQNRSLLPMDLGQQAVSRPNSFVSTKAMLWHNAIIDDILAHPGTTQKDIAVRLGKSPVTIGYIVNSDLFKMQLAQRREQFTRDLDERLIGKIASLAELAIDLTTEKLTTQRTGVPLPLLNDVMTKSLDRLGYGPKTAPPAVQVNVNQNNGTQQVVAPVSALALAEARATLRTVESSRSDPLEGRLAEIEHSDPASEPRAGEVEPLAARSAGEGEGPEGGL